jgi:hypothetical protein
VIDGDRAISGVDDMVDLVLDHLERKNALSNTYVFFRCAMSSDQRVHCMHACLSLCGHGEWFVGVARL